MDPYDWSVVQGDIFGLNPHKYLEIHQDFTSDGGLRGRASVLLFQMYTN